MSALFQLAMLVVLAAGMGYWVWLWARQPAPLRAVTWLWCGLAGFSVALLLLQALVYVDWPLRKSAPLLGIVAAVGFALLGLRLWRARPMINRRKWREIGLVLGAGAGAGLVHSTSLIGIGSDRFVGQAQIDHVNYVMMAQFLADEPFSTDLHAIGLRPWIWMPLQWKYSRLTQCVTLGTVAVLTGSDAQRSWGATAVFFTILLGTALAALWRVVGVPGWAAAGLGLAGAATPVVTSIYLIGFFSQLTALFVFPALIAVCWAGALPRGLAAVLAASLLGYLAGTYTEFWLIGVAVMGGSMLCWPLKLWQRAAVATAVALGSLLLTGIYATMVPAPLLRQFRGASDWTETLSGFVSDGISWRGWGRNFIAGSSPALAGAGGLVAGGMLLALALAPAHRRWRWLAALAGPAILAAHFLLASATPVYPTYKLLATFAPVCLGLAALGWFRIARQFGPGPGRAAAGLLGLGGGLVIWSAMAGHLGLVETSRHSNRERLERFWAVRDRVEQTHATYLLANGNALIGAWLAYFARDSSVYYDLPLLADSRIPTESAPFRRLPPGVRLQWLDLDRTGPVPPREPTPLLAIRGAQAGFEIAQRPVIVLGPEAELVLVRAGGFMPVEMEFSLEFGLTPLPGVGLCRLTVTDQNGAVMPASARSSSRISGVRLHAAAGRNVYRLHVQPVADPAGIAGPAKELALLQSLSVERMENAEQ